MKMSRNRHKIVANFLAFLSKLELTEYVMYKSLVAAWNGGDNVQIDIMWIGKG